MSPKENPYGLHLMPTEMLKAAGRFPMEKTSLSAQYLPLLNYDLLLPHRVSDIFDACGNTFE